MQGFKFTDNYQTVDIGDTEIFGWCILILVVKSDAIALARNKHKHQQASRDSTMSHIDTYLLV